MSAAQETPETQQQQSGADIGMHSAHDTLGEQQVQGDVGALDQPQQFDHYSFSRETAGLQGLVNSAQVPSQAQYETVLEGVAAPMTEGQNYVHTHPSNEPGGIDSPQGQWYTDSQSTFGVLVPGTQQGYGDIPQEAYPGQDLGRALLPNHAPMPTEQARADGFAPSYQIPNAQYEYGEDALNFPYQAVGGGNAGPVQPAPLPSLSHGPPGSALSGPTEQQYHHTQPQYMPAVNDSPFANSYPNTPQTPNHEFRHLHDPNTPPTPYTPQNRAGKPWTDEEVHQLQSFVQETMQKGELRWADCAGRVPGRSLQAIQTKYRMMRLQGLVPDMRPLAKNRPVWGSFDGSDCAGGNGSAGLPVLAPKQPEAMVSAPEQHQNQVGQGYANFWKQLESAGVSHFPPQPDPMIGGANAFTVPEIRLTPPTFQSADNQNQNLNPDDAELLCQFLAVPRPWTSKEDDWLIKALKLGYTVEEIAPTMDRSADEVESRHVEIYLQWLKDNPEEAL